MSPFLTYKLTIIKKVIKSINTPEESPLNPYYVSKAKEDIGLIIELIKEYQKALLIYADKSNWIGTGFAYYDKTYEPAQEALNFFKNKNKMGALEALIKERGITKEDLKEYLNNG